MGLSHFCTFFVSGFIFRNKGTGCVLQVCSYSEEMWKKDYVFFQSKEQNYLLHSIIKTVSPSEAEFRQAYCPLLRTWVPYIWGFSHITWPHTICILLLLKILSQVRSTCLHIIKTVVCLFSFVYSRIYELHNIVT